MYYAASAAPSPTAQGYAPQGFGDFLSGLAPVLQTLAPIALSLLQAPPTAAGVSPAGVSPYGAGPQPLSVAPQAAGPQAYAPQGFGDFLSSIAPLAPVLLSLLEAQPTAAGVSPAGVSPYGAGPQMLSAGPQAYAPQGFFGDLVGSIAPTIGGAIGDWAGNQQVGTQIGNLAGQAAKSWLPFSAAPTAAISPYGWNPAGLR